MAKRERKKESESVRDVKSLAERDDSNTHECPRTCIMTTGTSQPPPAFLRSSNSPTPSQNLPRHASHHFVASKSFTSELDRFQCECTHRSFPPLHTSFVTAFLPFLLLCLLPLPHERTTRTTRQPRSAVTANTRRARKTMAGKRAGSRRRGDA